MKPEKKEAFIIKKAAENLSDSENGKILWSKHAVSKLQSENLQRKEVESALTDCKVIQDYPFLERRLPDCLVLAFLPKNDPLIL